MMIVECNEKAYNSTIPVMDTIRTSTVLSLILLKSILMLNTTSPIMYRFKNSYASFLQKNGRSSR